MEDDGDRAKLLTFAELFEQWLDGVTPEMAASQIGISKRTARYWYNGDSLPPQTKLPLLARAFGFPLANLREIVGADRQARRKPEHL